MRKLLCLALGVSLAITPMVAGSADAHGFYQPHFGGFHGGYGGFHGGYHGGFYGYHHRFFSPGILSIFGLGVVGGAVACAYELIPGCYGPPPVVYQQPPVIIYQPPPYYSPPQ
jgi:hypothetical protein